MLEDHLKRLAQRLHLHHNLLDLKVNANFNFFSNKITLNLHVLAPSKFKTKFPKFGDCNSKD